MVEPLGVAAGSAGLVSFATLLGGSALKLKKFYKSVRSAPEDLKAIASEIDALSLLLLQLERNPLKPASQLSQVVIQRCIEVCSENCTEIEETATALEGSIRRHKIPGAVKTVLKEREIQDCLKRLERAKSTLQLAHQAYVGEQQIAAQERQEQRLEELLLLSNQVASLQLSSSTTTSLTQDGCSTAQTVPYARRRKRQYGRGAASYRLRLPFVNIIWQYRMSDTPSVWSFNLICFATVPANSAIFELCKKADLVGVKALLDSRQASVHDQDPWGWTALHYAVRSFYTSSSSERAVKLCDFLLASGALSESSTYHPLELISFEDRVNYQGVYGSYLQYLHALIEMIKLFVRRNSIEAEEIIDGDYHTLQWTLYFQAPAEAINMINQALCIPYTQRPIYERFLRAMKLYPSNYCGPDAFYAALGTTDLSHIVSLEHDIYGTVLHAAAAGMGKALSDNRADVARGWWPLVQRATRAGADLHALVPKVRVPVTLPGRTPMMVFLRNARTGVRCSSDLDRLVKAWARGVAEAGVDLVLYGRREKELWERRPLKVERYYQSRNQYPMRNYCMSDLTIGPQASDWAVESHTCLALYKFVPLVVPGAWESVDRLPRYDCGDYNRYPSPPREHGKWVRERWVVLKDPAKDPAPRKSVVCERLPWTSWDDSDSRRASREESRMRLCSFRRSRSIGTSVPDSGRETPEAFSTVSTWPIRYEKLNAYPWGYWRAESGYERMSAEILKWIEKGWL